MLKRRLVGFISQADSDHRIRECHLVIEQGAIAGRVTSVAYSPHLRSVFGLAMVDLSLINVGQQLSIRVSDSTMVNATVTDMPFYDPDNERQKIHITNNRHVA